MALSLPSTRVGVAAGRSGLPTTTTSVLASSRSADSFGGKCRKKGAAVCLQGPVLKSRVSDVGQHDSLSSSSLSSSYRAAQPVNQRQGSYTRVPGDEAHSSISLNSSALIDIEDSGDGCVTYKYGTVEDLWDLDRLLEHLSSGAFSSHTGESFVQVVMELFRVPMSYTAQRKMAQLISTQIRLHSDVSPEEMEKAVSQVLAEAASEFLPPSNVGSYSKGSARPGKRFSSRLDKWWKKLDDYFGVGEGSMDFLPEQEFEGSGGFSKLNQQDYEPFKPSFPQLDAQSLSENTTLFTWKDPPAQMPWLARSSETRYLETSKAMELVRESESSSEQQEGEGGYAVGLDFIMFRSQVESLEDVLRKTGVEESAAHPDLEFAPVYNSVQTLPAASIQEMVDWEQEEVVVASAITLPSKQKSRVKAKVKKTQTKKKIHDPQARGASSTRAAPKKKSGQLCDMFFGLPISHKNSGVGGVLALRKNFGGEILVVLNQVAVGFAGAGLAVALHVVSGKLSMNPTFNSAKLFGLIRGAALMWLSAAIQGVRKVMLRLPAGCSISDSKDKAEILCLQQRLRSLSFTALTVMVLTVVGHGV